MYAESNFVGARTAGASVMAVVGGQRSSTIAYGGVASAAIKHQPSLPQVARKHVYVVDDHAAVCLAFELMLGAHGYDVVSFASGDEFLAGADLHDGATLLLDQGLPGMSGLEILHVLRQRRCQMPVILMTGNGQIRNAVDAMKLGAVDYLEKPLEEQALMTLLGKVTPPPAAVKPNALLESLTLREREILQIMAQGLSSKEVAKQLNISPRTVDVHRCNILTKLGVNSMLVAIRMLRLG